MAESASQVTINDIPEELKPYRTALLNAAYGQVFNQDYLRNQFPGAQFLSGYQPPQQPPTAPPTAPPDYGQQPDLGLGYPNHFAGTGMGSSLGSSADAITQILERANRVGYAKGGLAQAAEDIERLLGGKSIPDSDVTLGASGTPLGGYTPPMMVSPVANIPYNIGTGVRPPPTPQPPSVTPPPGSVGGIINTPPSGSLPIGNPNPTPPPQVGGGMPGGQPPPPHGIPQPLPNPNAIGGTSTTPMFVANRPDNFAGASQAQAAGYNPAQYADESVAQQLASQLGGRTVYTNTGGPIGPPSQAMIDAGGSNMHNAGLMADINRRFANDEGMRNFALQNLRDEIRSYGGDTGGFAKGGIVKLAVGGFPDNEVMGGPTGLATNPFAPTGTATKETAPNPMTVNPFGASTASGATGPTPPGMQAGAFNPYQGYGSTDPTTGQFVGTQRILGMGDQGQVASNGYLQSSDLTRDALAGYGGMPSYFSNGEIFAGRTDGGQATTPLGIANDVFDTAGNLALGASQNAEWMSGRNPLSSSFGTALQRIAENPNMFQAGDISLAQLRAPQLDAPIGVGTSQLTSYQMAGPRMINTVGGMIDPSYLNTAGGNVTAGQIGVGRFVDPGVADEYMSPYMRKVLDVQKERANQDFGEARAGRSAAAIRAGAFGGNRQAVADSLAERDNQLLLSQIEAQGNQSAYENAQQQFERDRGASMVGQQFNVGTKLQADLANQGLGFNTGVANQQAYLDAAGRNQQTGLQAQMANQNALQQANSTNLGAALGVQELGANQYMQSQLANQGAGLTAGQANLGAALQTQNLGRTSGLSAAQSNQNTRLAQNTTLLDAIARADQLQQQADQGNFTNQLGAMGQQTQSALAANSIGQNRADLGRLAQAQELLRLQSMGQAGAGIDTRTQGALDLGYQDWTNQQNYPYQQMNWLQSMLSGVPMGYNQEGVQFQRTNPLSQIAGLGTAALGAYGAYRNPS